MHVIAPIILLIISSTYVHAVAVDAVVSDANAAIDVIIVKLEKSWKESYALMKTDDEMTPEMLQAELAAHDAYVKLLQAIKASADASVKTAVLLSEYQAERAFYLGEMKYAESMAERMKAAKLLAAYTDKIKQLEPKAAADTEKK